MSEGHFNHQNTKVVTNPSLTTKDRRTPTKCHQQSQNAHPLPFIPEKKKKKKKTSLNKLLTKKTHQNTTLQAPQKTLKATSVARAPKSLSAALALAGSVPTPTSRPPKASLVGCGLVASHRKKGHAQAACFLVGEKNGEVDLDSVVC